MEPMDKRTLTEEQLQHHLRVQMEHLRTSSQLYDEGRHSEAVRLGTTVNNLMHNKGKSRSLLGQLGLRDSIEFVDTGTYRSDIEAWSRSYIDQAFGPDSGMVVAAANPGEVGLVTATHNTDADLVWVPVLGNRGARENRRKVWWERQVIETSFGGSFSREQLVHVMRNMDGGGHVDPAIDVRYDDFRSDNLGFQYSKEAGDWTLEDPPSGWHNPIGNIANASMRQIAWEIEQTIWRLGLPYLAAGHG
jgi:hypothetical protein